MLGSLDIGQQKARRSGRACVVGINPASSSEREEQMINCYAKAALAVIALGVSAPTGLAQGASTDGSKLCYLDRAAYYARQTCDPAPFLVGAVFGSCIAADQESLRLSRQAPEYEPIPYEDFPALMDDLREAWKPRIEAEIVNIRIAEGLCR